MRNRKPVEGSPSSPDEWRQGIGHIDALVHLVGSDTKVAAGFSHDS